MADKSIGLLKGALNTSPDNSFQAKEEIEINISQNHAMGISPEKQENNNGCC